MHVVMTRWDPTRKSEFCLIRLDSLLSGKEANSYDLQHQELATWSKNSTLTHDSISVLPRKSKVNKVHLPQFPMEHLLSFALPSYDNKTGLGIYGTTIWLEAMQRQALAAVFLINQDTDDSFYTIQHLWNHGMDRRP